MSELSSKRVLCYDGGGLFVSLALRLASMEAFAQVDYFRSWQDGFCDGRELVVGSGLDEFGVGRLKYFWPSVNDYDLIVFPDCWDGDLQEYLRSIGKRVWGTGMKSALEQSRWKTKDLIKQIGLPSNEATRIVGITKLREYLQANKNVFVKISTFRGLAETFESKDYIQSKSQLDELEAHHGAIMEVVEFIVEAQIPESAEVGYDGYCVDGEFPNDAFFGFEIKNRAYAGKLVDYDSLPEEVKEANTKLSYHMDGYRQFWSTELRNGFVIDITARHACFSSDTEILTNNGWKLFKDISKTDTVATLNPNGRVIEYQAPTNYHAYRYNGEMVKISNRKKTIECLVTPNHKVWRTHGKCKMGSLWSENADSLTTSGFIPRSGRWTGMELRWFELSKYENQWKSGRHLSNARKHLTKSVKIPMDSWLKFLGLYLSEGSVGCHGHTVYISQKKHKKLFGEILSELPLKISEVSHGWQIASTQLAEYCKQFGTCSEKYVPQFVKELSPRQIRIFLEAFGLGDGSFRECGRRAFYTTSKRIADDFLELILKVGDVANFKINQKAGSEMSVHGKSYFRNHDGLVIEWLRQSDFWFEAGKRKAQSISKVQYDGTVYCVSVPNQIVYVRRNGKPFWSGNSPAGETFCQAFDNLPEILWEGAGGVLVHPKTDAKFVAQIILRSPWATHHVFAIEFPEEIREFVKIYNHCRIDGVDYCIPDDTHAEEVGSVVAMGATIDEACSKAKALAKQISGFQMKADADALDEAVKMVKNSK